MSSFGHFQWLSVVIRIGVIFITILYFFEFFFDTFYDRIQPMNHENESLFGLFILVCNITLCMVILSLDENDR